MKMLEDDWELSDKKLCSLEQQLIEEGEELLVLGRQLLDEQEQLLL